MTEPELEPAPPPRHSRRSLLGLSSAAVALSLVAGSASAASFPELKWGIERTGTAADLDAITAAVGHAPQFLLSFFDWAQPVAKSRLDEAYTRGAIPLITWEPWLAQGGIAQPDFRLARITEGGFDKYITSWAQGLATWGKTVYLRFAQEMNGDWYPWSESVNGNQAGDYTRAWQHVRSIFWANGARNVVFVWCPQAPPAAIPLRAVYPGDAYVSVLSLDGYNFGDPWLAPPTVFQQGLTELRAIATKPIFVSETSCTEDGGDKAAWITSLFHYMNQQTDVIGLVWFNEVVRQWDWTYNSTSKSADAFVRGVASRRRA